MDAVLTGWAAFPRTSGGGATSGRVTGGVLVPDAPGGYQAPGTELSADGRLRVTSAPRRIRIPAELLCGMEAGEIHEDVAFADGLLTITAVNRTVSYRIGKYLMAPDCYEAERVG